MHPVSCSNLQEQGSILCRALILEGSHIIQDWSKFTSAGPGLDGAVKLSNAFVRDLRNQAQACPSKLVMPAMPIQVPFPVHPCRPWQDGRLVANPENLTYIYLTYV